MTDWDLLMPGIGLTALGIAGVGLSLAGIAAYFSRRDARSITFGYVYRADFFGTRSIQGWFSFKSSS